MHCGMFVDQQSINVASMSNAANKSVQALVHIGKGWCHGASLQKVCAESRSPTWGNSIRLRLVVIVL